MLDLPGAGRTGDGEQRQLGELESRLALAITGEPFDFETERAHHHSCERSA